MHVCIGAFCILFFLPHSNSGYINIVIVNIMDGIFNA